MDETPELRAAGWFLRRRQGRLGVEEHAAFESWLGASPENAEAWEETARTWQSFDDHATLPELVVAREQALAAVRQAQVKRWDDLGASSRSARFRRPALWFGAAATALVVCGALWQAGVLGGEVYKTGIGEQRTVLLPDNSNMILDAMTRVRVRYDGDQRRIEMLEGQAQFEVAREGGRPFRVNAGGRTVEALGTTFTVTYIDRRMQVALIEGLIKVHAEDSANVQDTARVLHPGEALSIDADGKQMLRERSDLAAATAWRHGKVIFQQEPLRDAVERLNRYSRVRLAVADPEIERWPVSGIFGVGDAEAFAEAIESYFPIEARHATDDTIELRRKH